MIYRILFLIFSTAGCMGIAQGTYIQAKASIAQYLLIQAWQTTLKTGEPRKPWPWADTWPVARLSVPSQHKSLIVLEGASGEAMAFGPARLNGHNPAAGVTVIGGHRDTHLAFLRDMNRGQKIELQTSDGKIQHYRWSTHMIANATTDRLAVDLDKKGLILITCYPFSAMQTGGPLRFVMMAEPIENTSIGL